MINPKTMSAMKIIIYVYERSEDRWYWRVRNTDGCLGGEWGSYLTASLAKKAAQRNWPNRDSAGFEYIMAEPPQ